MKAGEWEWRGNQLYAPGRQQTLLRDVTFWNATDVDKQMITAAPNMLDALQNVNKLISEAAVTGFNCHDGDWAERLFASQQQTSEAIRAAVGKPMQAIRRPKPSECPHCEYD